MLGRSGAEKAINVRKIQSEWTRLEMGAYSPELNTSSSVLTVLDRERVSTKCRLTELKNIINCGQLLYRDIFVGTLDRNMQLLWTLRDSCLSITR